MTHTMPALVLNGPGDVQVAEKPIPTPGPGEVVLAVEATTICGTDLRIISGEKTAGVRPGVTLGHEIAGRIASSARGGRTGCRATGNYLHRRLLRHLPGLPRRTGALM